MPPNPPPTNPIVTDDELKRAVAHRCHAYEPPVAKTGDVADVEFIDVKPQTVKRRLDTLEEEGEVNSLKVGRGKVWWVPEDDSEGYNVDGTSSIYWAGIDPEEIPAEMVEKHPAFPNPDWWDQLRDRGNNMLRDAGIPALIGFAILLLSDVGVPYITIGNDIVTVSTLAFLGGVLFVVLGFGFVAASSLGRRLEEDGVLDRLERLREKSDA